MRDWKLILIHVTPYACFLLFTLYFYGGGEGSYIPFLIFWGWAALPFALDPTSTTFLIPPVLQSVAYMALWMAARRQHIPLQILQTLPFLHVLGSVVSFARLSFSHYDLIYTFSGTVFYLLSYLVPIVLLGPYWAIYLRSARRGLRAKD